MTDRASGPRRIARSARRTRRRRRWSSPRRSCCAAVPAVGRATARSCKLVEIFYYLSLAQMWNLLAGYAGLVSVGQQAFVGVGAYTLFVLSEQHNLDPFVAIGIAGAARGRAVDPGRAVRLPAAGRLLRHRHVGDRRGVPAGDPADRVARRGQRAVVHGEEHVLGLLARRPAAPHLLARARRSPSARRCIVVLILRSRRGLAMQATRDNDASARSASASTSAAPSSSCGPSPRSGPGRPARSSTSTARPSPTRTRSACCRGRRRSSSSW